MNDFGSKEFLDLMMYNSYSISTRIKESVREQLKWVKGGRTGKKDLKDFKRITVVSIVDKMMEYMVERVMDGDICIFPDKSTYMYVGYNHPLAIERMRLRPDYPYKKDVIPGFIKISSNTYPSSYLSVLMSRKNKFKLIDKINEGREYYQPIPLHRTYHEDRFQEEMDAWNRIKKKKKCNTLTWTI